MAEAATPVRRAAHTRLVTIEKFADMSGLSQGAVRKRIERAIWAEGKHYRRCADGRIYIDTLEVERWQLGEEA